ncbi:MAG TPA: hypothetical protein PLV83_02225 [Bacilli bacterium]|nr:hypothetical protein [Bacilli bacterium]
MKSNIELSSLNHTWIFDIDGTIVKHNGYKIDGTDTLLPGIKEFFDENICENDYVLLVTSRTDEFKEITEKFLNENKIRFNNIIFGLPYGERILINDRKPSGLDMSIAINTNRNQVIEDKIIINNNL